MTDDNWFVVDLSESSSLRISQYIAAQIFSASLID